MSSQCVRVPLSHLNSGVTGFVRQQTALSPGGLNQLSAAIIRCVHSNAKAHGRSSAGPGRSSASPASSTSERQEDIWPLNDHYNQPAKTCNCLPHQPEQADHVVACNSRGLLCLFDVLEHTLHYKPLLC